jgi:hypothetical protein
MRYYTLINIVKLAIEIKFFNIYYLLKIGYDDDDFVSFYITTTKNTYYYI